MNKVFKVIWSEARNAYVVVSEIAKNHGSKSCSTKKLLAMLIATGVMTCASMAPAMAADPPAEALKHSTVAAGYNITVTTKDNSDGGKEYNVDLKNDINLQGDDPDALVGISGSKGTIWATGSVTVGSGVDGSVVMDGTTATVSGLGNTTTAYAGFANGKGKAATEEQLKEISEVAENANQGWNLSTNGGEASKVAPGETVDFSGDQNINISNDGTKVKVELKNDIYLAGDDPNAFVNISGSKGTIWASSSVTAGSVAVGTAKADGTTPFFVDSNGAFYAADSKFSVDKDGNANANSIQTNALNSKYNLSVGTANENGTVPFFVNSNGAFYAANGKLVVDKDGKVTATAGEIGNVVLQNGVYYGHSTLQDGSLLLTDDNGNHSYIDAKSAKLGKVTVAEDGKISGVAAGEISKTSTDAINGSQLNQTNENVAALDKRVTDNETAIKNNADAIKNNADAIKNNTDAIKNNADAISGLNTRVDKVEALAGKHTTLTNGTNISVQETDVDGQKNYKVNMNKDIILGNLTGKNVNISGTNGTIETTGYIATKDRVYADKGAKLADIDVTGNKISNGASSIVLDGSNVKVNDKVTIDQNGKVTGVADGDVKENSKDAVNGSQLYKTNQEVVNNTNRINQLGSRVNKVGAGAAALAALHPMDFDPDDKLTFSAGYGNYGGENAAAIGAYYRPDEKVMFSIGGTVGNGENMVNAGVSFSLDRTNHVSNSRTALAREVIDLRGQLAVMGAKMAKMEKAFGMLDESKTKLFPDVPANHWAYEYIAKLAGNGYIEGYPDGNFGGDRLMTRYEFAAMLYRAIENGAALEEKIIKEFEPELGRIRVDRISGEDGDRDKIERVRVNDTKGERDHYGNKLAK